MDHERLAVVETKIDAAIHKIDNALVRIEAMENKFSRYHGFIGGMLFLAAGVWTFLIHFKDWLSGKL